jgi:hypothetical protein
MEGNGKTRRSKGQPIKHKLPLNERDTRRINLASLSMAFEASLTPLFCLYRYPIVVGQTVRKDACTSREAFTATLNLAS